MGNDDVSTRITQLEKAAIENADGHEIMDAPGEWDLRIIYTKGPMLLISNIKLAEQFADWLQQTSILSIDHMYKRLFSKVERNLRDSIKRQLRTTPEKRCDGCRCIKCVCKTKRCVVCKDDLLILGILAWCPTCKDHFEVEK